MAAKKTEENKLGNFIDSFQGDKVIWMIVLLLMLISILTVFTSTPLLALQSGQTRFDIVKEHLLIVLLGLGVIILLYNIRSIKFFKIISKYGFALSALLLVFVTFKIGADTSWPVRAAEVNSSWRIIKFFGIQLHVYEVVKVAMVMYLAWAVNAMKEDAFGLTRRLHNLIPSWDWLEKPLTKKCIYIYFPILFTAAMMFNGGTSATALFVGMMLLILFVGGIDMREIFGVMALMAVYIAIVITFGLSDRFHNVNIESRTGSTEAKLEKVLKEEPANRRTVIDDMKLEQPVGALLAIKEGGFFGKWIGHSNQKYKVAVIFEDYIFSFIVEETGWWGALIIVVLYLSLMARGRKLALICDDYFAKFAMAGLIVLITVQAFMHIAINVHLLPQTGQTLPMISHGASSFLCFSAAFGIILSISRMAHNQMLKDSQMAAPIIEKNDDVQNSLNDLDILESEEMQ